VRVKGKYHQTIRETEVNGTSWAVDHWKALAQNYRRAPHFAEVAAWLEPIYTESFDHLSALNRRLIEAVCAYVGIDTRISNSWDYSLPEGKTERLASLCAQAGGGEYISGPAAREYVDEKVFSDQDIKLTWFDYADYPAYPQLWGDYVHGVTIFDLLFNCGKRAPNYMRYVGS